MDSVAVVKVLKKLKDMVDKNCGARTDQINKFLKDNASHICGSPASTHKDAHCCFPGGLLVHTVNVIETAEQLRKMYFPDLDKGSVFFVALMHYMGKASDGQHQIFIDQTDQYYSKIYKYKLNEQARFALAQDRTLFLLHKYQIPATADEWYALRNYGGAFHRENYAYTNKMSDLEVVLSIAVQITTRMERNAGKKLSKSVEQEMSARS